MTDAETPETPEQPPERKGYYCQVKPNRLWPEEIRALIRGYVAAKGEKLPPCPACGTRRRGRWTMLSPFRAYTLGQFAVQEAGTFEPLTLVCSEHPIMATKAILEALDVRTPPAGFSGEGKQDEPDAES
jgi:hypothetical protein